MSFYPTDLTKYQLNGDKIFPLVSVNHTEVLLGSTWSRINDIASRVGTCYSPYDLKKFGTTKWRHIDNPNKELKILQKKINRHILSKITLPETMTGGVGGKSIKDNASVHVHKRIVVCLDLRNCFPNTNHEVVYSIYRNGLGCSTKISRILTILTTFQNRVPQGAPSSSTIVNFALLPLHDDIADYCTKNNLSWSFYIDDITFSGDNADCHIDNIIKLIQKRGYAVRNSKIKVMRSNKPQLVTGIMVNRKINKSNKVIEKLRREIISVGARSYPVTQQELTSVWGKINHIENICPIRGESLKLLAKKHLPVKVVVVKTSNNLDEHKKCNTSAKCLSLQRS